MEQLPPSGVSVTTHEPELQPEPQVEKKSVFAEARERREARKEKKGQGWKNLKEKLKEFGNKLKDASEVGGEIVRSPDLWGAAVKEGVDAVVEKNSQIVDKVSTRLAGVWEGAKAEWHKQGEAMGKKVDGYCNRANEAIDKKSGEVVTTVDGWGKEMVNSFGREVAGPVIEVFFIPVVQTIDEAHRLVSDIGSRALDALASPIESVTSRVLAVAEIPEVKFIREMGERARTSEGKMNWFRRMEAKIGGWIDKAVNLSNDLSLDSKQLRADARSIKEWYARNKGSRNETIQAAGALAGQMKQGVL
ncbi:MAG: hypothetical protein UW35_C0027G0016 [Candidatus Collierbacteria bacterium GW2011_GWF2_44_15]|uniref:Uncharacterized protein n=1 Tax=Candidatus Collierbacteria bacterium GW2011_GWF2_44_15 TaxID=1618404 RepID=A0A0G1JPP5_9BACT|nr:MAG: hypothetical protein UW35_C0027G0016 [Candidatus Collierbacteria bacterium GW2011_GWF2_44_15]